MTEIFTTVTLPMGGSATIFEAKGKHFYSAAIKANGNTNLITKYLMIEVVKINNEALTEEYVDNMHLKDIIYLTECINVMMSNEDMGFF